MINQLQANLKKGRKFLVVSILLKLVTLVAIYCNKVPPQAFWWTAFIAYSTPFLIGFNMLFLVIWLLRKSPYILIPLFTIIYAWPQVRATYAMNGNYSQVEADVKLVSFNLRAFKGYGTLDEFKIDEAKAIIDWLLSTKADIICLQEYYNSSERYGFSVMKTLMDAGYVFHSFSPAKMQYNKGDLGVMIFSKHPIITSRTIYRAENSNNQMVSYLVNTPKGKLNIFNVHLHSLQLKERELETSGGRSKVSGNVQSVAWKLRHGFIERGFQVELLVEEIKRAEDYVIVTGDCNDLPYSFTYNTLKVHLRNAFEDAGSGFGFSYNGKIPFLRIDNQFYDKRLKAVNFQTHQDVSYSDHFPISASYILP